MDPLTFEAVTRNPEIMRALMEQARRERAAAVHRLIVESIKSLFKVRRHAAGAHLPAAQRNSAIRPMTCRT
jgi:hypothetical protein